MSKLRSMTNADLLAYKQLCSICYTYTADANPPQELPEEKLRIRRGCFDDDGRLLSAMMQIPYEVRFCNHTVPMVGIGGVVTDPAARSQGAIRRIFENDLPRLYQEGYVFSALYPFSYRFYGKFGYTWAEFGRTAVIPRGSLRVDLRKAEEIIRVLPGEDDQGMREIWAQYTADKHLAVLRDAEMWDELRKGTPWDSLKHAYVLRIDGKPVAYWIGKMNKQGWSCTLQMQDLAWTCHAGLEAIFAMLRGMNEVDKVTVCARSGFDPRVLTDETYDIEWSGYSEGMVRVINAERALALLPAPVLPGRLTIEVTDEQIPENCGKFTVNGDGYALTVERDEHAQAGLRCDIRALTALVMGRQSFADAVDMGLVKLLSGKNTRFAELLFTERKLHLDWSF